MKQYISCWRCDGDPVYYVESADPFEDASFKRGRLSVLTRTRNEQLLGNVVWGIDEEGSPPKYYLWGWFVVERVKKVTTVDNRFRYVAWGDEGVRHPRGIRLNRRPWFPGFHRDYLSKLGLNPKQISNEIVSHFCEIFCSAGLQPPRYAPPSDVLLPSGDSQPVRRKGFVERVVRETIVTGKVKQLHKYRCQVCGLRMETPVGPYAEGAHIRPLGSPHDGPDVPANVLCLCPNHHVLFDSGAFTIGDDLKLIGEKGGLRTANGHRLATAHLKYHREVIRGKASKKQKSL